MSSAEQHAVLDQRKSAGGPPATEGRKRRAPCPLPGSRILALQAAAGNRATTLLVQQAAGSGTRRSEGWLHPAPIGSPAPAAVAGPPATDHHTPAANAAVPGRYSVQRDLGSIEKELKRRFLDEDDPGLLARRAALSEQVGRLDDAESLTLVFLLLNAAGNNVFTDRFQTLSSSTRFILLAKLFGQLGHVRAELMFTSLTSGTDWVAKGYKIRFKQLVPEPQRRQELLATLSNQFAAAHAAQPNQRWVNWGEANFRTSGGFSPDNDCQKGDFSGLGLDPKSGYNVMELRGDVVGHTPDTVYDIKRTIELRTWNLIGGLWKPAGSLPAGTDDDKKGNHDEDLTPEPSHLYVIDGPGPPFDMDFNQNATGYVYSASFVEWVMAKVGSAGWQKVSDDFEWHTNTALKKVNGQWRRDMTRPNHISSGPQPLVEPAP